MADSFKRRIARDSAARQAADADDEALELELLLAEVLPLDGREQYFAAVRREAERRGLVSPVDGRLNERS